MTGMLLNAALMMLHAQRVSIAFAVGYSSLSSIPMTLGLKSSMQSGMAFVPTPISRINLRSLHTKYLHHPTLQINGNFSAPYFRFIDLKMENFLQIEGHDYGRIQHHGNYLQQTTIQRSLLFAPHRCITLMGLRTWAAPIPQLQPTFCPGTSG
jgi:hypothetical protein